MSKLDSLLDTWLFATSRYVDKDGAPASFTGGFLSPQTIIIAGGTLSMAFGFAAAGNVTNVINAFVMGGLMITGHKIGGRIGERVFGRSDYYFDSKPEKTVCIFNEAVKQKLEDTRKNVVGRALTNGVVGACLNGAAVYLTTGNLATAGIIATLSAGNNMINNVAKWWGAKQALEGNWNVLRQYTYTGGNSKRAHKELLAVFE